MVNNNLSDKDKDKVDYLYLTITAWLPLILYYFNI
jgi:hypothetical protein